VAGIRRAPAAVVAARSVRQRRPDAGAALAPVLDRALVAVAADCVLVAGRPDASGAATHDRAPVVGRADVFVVARRTHRSRGRARDTATGLRTDVAQRTRVAIAFPRAGRRGTGRACGHDGSRGIRADRNAVVLHGAHIVIVARRSHLLVPREV